MNRLAKVAIAAAGLVACHGQTPAPKADQISFVADGSVLYREDASGRTPLLALDSATAPAGVLIAPSQWSPAPGSTFGVAARTFRHVVASSQHDFVAWETNGAVHDLLGVIRSDGSKLDVLDFYFDSSADSLKWSADGKQLKAFYTPPSGIAEVRVYDAAAGKRVK